MEKSALPPLAILALFLLCGCVQQLPADKRLLCLDLTSKSHAFLPECKTQQECFSGLEKTLFDFDESQFSPEIQREIDSYKNSAAASWAYFNEAGGNIDEIHGICGYSGNISLLPQQLNELTHNLHKAFEFSDSANRQSFAILLLEENDLRRQDINMAKEEPLFNDFAAISENLAAVSADNYCGPGSGNYSCFYLREMQSLNMLVQSTGFSSRLTAETTVLDLLEGKSKAIANYSEKILKIPFLSGVLPSFVSYINNYFRLNDAVGGLETIPAFGFLQQYGRFMGTDNSCLQKFSSMLKSDSLHRAGLRQRNSVIAAEISGKTIAAQAGIETLKGSEYASFDGNFLQELYAAVGQESAIATQRYSIRDFTEFNREAEKQLEGFRAEAGRIEREDTLGAISLGKKSSALKELNAKLQQLQENIEFLSSDVISGLLVLCGERIAMIKSRLEDAELPEEYLLQAADLKARVRYRAGLFSSARTEKEKLSACRSSVEEFNRFTAALKDFESYNLAEKTALEGCFSFINAVLGAKQRSINLDDFLPRQQRLMSIEKPYADIAAVERICSSLRSDIENFLRGSESVREAESFFAGSKGAIETLRLVNKRDGKSLGDSTLENFESQFRHFSGFFSGATLALEKAVPVLDELKSGLGEFSSSLSDAVGSAVASFAERNAVVRIEEASASDGASSGVVSVSFENPFGGVDGLLTLKVPFDSTLGSILLSSPNIGGVRSNGSQILVDLNGLPPGGTAFSFSTTESIRLSETTELVSADSGDAFLRKKVEINCTESLPKAQIKLQLLDSSEAVFSNILATVEGRPVQHSLQGNSISFIIAGCSGKRNAAIDFHVLDPVRLSSRITGETSDKNSVVYSYEITVENRLPIDLKELHVSIPLQLGGSEIKKIELADSSGKKLPGSLLQGKILTGIALLRALQSETLSLAVSVPAKSQLPPIALQPAGADSGKEAAQGDNAPDENVLLAGHRIDSLGSAIAAGEEKIAVLKKAFSSVSARDLVSAKYIPPISEAELDRLLLKLNNAKSALSKKTVLDFISLSEAGNFSAASKKAAQFSEKLGEDQAAVGQIGAQLENALNALKEDAFSSYNSAVELFNRAPENSAAEGALESAKSALAKEDFLAVIVNSKKAASLLPASGAKSGFDFPLLAVPPILAVALVVAVRFRKKKTEKQRKRQLRRILRNW